MYEKDKEILIVRIDTLRNSINDPLLDSVFAVMRDIVASIDIKDIQELGFIKKQDSASK